MNPIRNDVLRPSSDATEAASAAGANPEFIQSVLDGLKSRPRRLSPKYFYDERGSTLFEEITTLPEYYLTRSERAIMEAHADEMADRMGPGCCLIELGSGSSLKTRLLLDRLSRPAAYVPIDICREQLLRSADELCREYPDLRVIPLHEDFSRLSTLPAELGACANRVVYFPGSTIGNLEPEEVRDLFHRVGAMVGSSGGFLLGADLRKDPQVLEAAYNDARGVTGEFNLNLLHRLARDLGARIRTDSFSHLAFYNQVVQRNHLNGYAVFVVAILFLIALAIIELRTTALFRNLLKKGTELELRLGMPTGFFHRIDKLSRQTGLSSFITQTWGISLVYVSIYVLWLILLAATISK